MSRRAMALFALLVLLAMIIQVAVLPVYLRPPFKPDLLLVIMVFVALRCPFEVGFPLSWLLGLLSDLVSGLYLGLNAMTFLVVFLIIRSISDRLYADSALLFVIAVAGVTFAGFTLNLMLLVMLTASPGIAYSMVVDIVPRLLVNSFAASLVTIFPGFDRQLEVS